MHAAFRPNPRICCLFAAGRSSRASIYIYVTVRHGLRLGLPMYVLTEPVLTLLLAICLRPAGLSPPQGGHRAADGPHAHRLIRAAGACVSVHTSATCPHMCWPPTTRQARVPHPALESPCPLPILGTSAYNLLPPAAAPAPAPAPCLCPQLLANGPFGMNEISLSPPLPLAPASSRSPRTSGP